MIFEDGFYTDCAHFRVVHELGTVTPLCGNEINESGCPEDCIEFEDSVMLSGMLGRDDG